MGESNSKEFIESFEDFSLKSVYTVDLSNKYMKIHESRSRSLFDL